MYYHAKIEYGGTSHYWWNKDKESLIQDLLVPFVNGQVIVINRSSSKALLNMKSVTLVKVYRTEMVLKPQNGETKIKQINSLEFQRNECTVEIMHEVTLVHAAIPTRSLLQRSLSPAKPQIFVIMKFGDRDLDSAYEGVMKPIAKEFGLTALRIDEIQDSGKITDQILEQIASSKYVLADLTGERPNCYYECGFAHALGKELILSIKSSQPIHFDLAGYRFLTWDTESEFRRKLRNRLHTLERASNEDTD